MSVRLGLHYSLSSTTGSDWADLHEASIEQAVAAEGYGFDSVVVAEHHFTKDGWVPSPTVICGGLATRTRRIRIGTDIIVMPLHHPVTVAEDMVTLDTLSRGRAICGLGLGWRELEFETFGVPFKQRVGRLEEGTDLVRRLLTEENVTYRGRYWHIENITVTPRPVQRPGPPIWIGAIIEPAVRRAGRIGDAWVMPPRPTLGELVKLQAAYREDLTTGGRSFDRVEKPLRREGYVAEDDETAWREAGAALRFQYAEVYGRISPTMPMDELKKYAQDRFIVGGPETFIREVKRYQSAMDVDLLLMRMQLPGIPQDRVMNAVHLLGKYVLPKI
jgi:alkanesulfonate monooxygenase SsuD/methylene tetrahydromethanopterin reductase-like flavin-dependent oxidoreductase (luciferase family)